MPLTASAVIGGLGAASKIVGGFINEHKAAEIEKRNKRPDFNIEDEYFQNRDAAASSAQHGLSESSLNFAKTNAERGLSASLGAMLETGAGANDVGSLYDHYNRSNLETAATDSQLQESKLKNFIDQNSQLAGQKTQRWVLNKYEPYKDKARAAAEMRGAAAQNIQTGISELAGTASSFATAQNNLDTNNPSNVNNPANAAYMGNAANGYAAANGWNMPASSSAFNSSTKARPLLYQEGGAVVPPNDEDVDWGSMYNSLNKKR